MILVLDASFLPSFINRSHTCFSANFIWKNLIMVNKSIKGKPHWIVFVLQNKWWVALLILFYSQAINSSTKEDFKNVRNAISLLSSKYLSPFKVTHYAVCLCRLGLNFWNVFDLVLWFLCFKSTMEEGVTLNSVIIKIHFSIIESCSSASPT